MKTICRVRLLWLITLCLGLSPLAAEEMFEKETLGKLKLGQKGAAVIKVLGKPESKGKEELWDAIGEAVQDWNYPKQGVTLAMSSEKKGGEKETFSITAVAPCQLATSRGITIGSTEAELKKAYRAEWDKEASEAGKLFVAGSIYGGVIFNLKGGKVVQIFIGAAAE